MANTNILTAKELHERLDEVCNDAKIFVYVGPDGSKVQAECAGYHEGGNHTPQLVLLLSSPNAIPTAGGACI